jgi:hypothetical protein
MASPAFTLDPPAAKPPAPGQHRTSPTPFAGAPSQHSGGTPTPHAPPAGTDSVALCTNMSATFRVFWNTAGGPGYIYNPYDMSTGVHPLDPSQITVVVSDQTIITKATCDARFLKLTSGNLQGACTVTVGYKTATTYVLNVTVTNSTPLGVVVDVYSGQ